MESCRWAGESAGESRSRRSVPRPAGHPFHERPNKPRQSGESINVHKRPGDRPLGSSYQRLKLTGNAQPAPCNGGERAEAHCAKGTTRSCGLPPEIDHSNERRSANSAAHRLRTHVYPSCTSFFPAAAALSGSNIAMSSGRRGSST